MKKRFLTGRGLLAAAILAAGAGTATIWALPAQAAGTPQIGVVASYSGGIPVTLGHPKPEATAQISPSYVAYNGANGDEAVEVISTPGTGEAARVYLIAGATEPNEYHIETTATHGTYGTLIKGDVYLVAGDATGAGMTSRPGAGTTVTLGESSTVAATANQIAPISVEFDNVGNLLIGEAHQYTGPTESGIQMVAKAACASSCAYGYGSEAAGGLYTVAGIGSWRGETLTPAITYGSQVEAYSLAVDAAGDIAIGANGSVLFLNEQTAAHITRYGHTMAPHSATKVAGTAVHGAATCGGGAVNVLANGATSPNLVMPHPAFDKHGNIYVNDDSTTATHGCTWVLPAATGTLDSQSMTAGRLYSLTGAATGTAYTSGATANTIAFPNAAEVTVDPVGNVVIALSGTTPTVRVIAESNGSFYGKTMVAGDVYQVAGGGAGTAPGNATGFGFAGAARTASIPEYGITSLTNGASGDLLMTDGTSATTGFLYEMTGAPGPVVATITSITLTKGTTAGGTHVTVHGTHLGAATAVHFGATAGTILTLTSTAVIKVKTPAHAAAKVSVSVTTPTFTTGTLATAFTFVVPTTITTTLTVSPHGHTYAGTTITLKATISAAQAGTVEFEKTGVTLHTEAATGLTTTYPTSIATAGHPKFKAKFTPTSTLYAGSTSATVTYTVTAVPGVKDTVIQPFAQTVTPGNLTLSCTRYATGETALAPTGPGLGVAIKTCPLITFTKVTLNGLQQTRTKLMEPIFIYTARGTSTSGWSLSAAMITSTGRNPNASCAHLTDFCNGTDGTHATTANGHGQIKATLLTLSTSYACSKPATNANPCPARGAFGVFGHTPLVLLTATAGTSGGEFEVSGGHYKLTIPADTYHGKYYGTVEYTLVSTT